MLGIRISETDGGSIEVDLHCLNCGYNLRGLFREGECPECGVFVGHSVHRSMLRYSNRTWLSLVRWGARLICIGLAALLCVLVAITSLFLAVVRIELLPHMDPALYLVLGVCGLVLLASPLVMFVGTWMICSAEPKDTANAGKSRLLTTRLSALAAVGLLLMRFVVSDLPALVAGLWSGLIVGAACVAVFSLGLRMKRLTNRTLQADLQEKWHRFSRNSLFVFGLIGMTVVLIHVAQVRGNVDSYEIISCVGVLALFGSLYLLVFGLTLFRRFGDLVGIERLRAKEAAVPTA